MSFIQDLEVWQKNEHTVLEMVRKLFPKTDWRINEERKWVDILSSSWLSIECKFDRMAETTWNIFIEVECNGKPSWIYKYDKIHVLTYTYWQTTLLMNVEKLKRFIQENESKLRKIKGWDGWRSVGYLIRIADIKPITSIIITHYDKNQELPV